MSCAVFWRARRASQNIDNEWKYSVILHDTTNKLLITNCFFFPAWSFCAFLIGREKQSGKRSVAPAADWLNRFFLQYKITNCPNNRTISQDICTLFARYFYPTSCSWIIWVNWSFRHRLLNTYYIWHSLIHMGPKAIFYCRGISLNRYNHTWTLLSPSVTFSSLSTSYRLYIG